MNELQVGWRRAEVLKCRTHLLVGSFAKPAAWWILMIGPIGRVEVVSSSG
jgi:hypothetical protein